MSPRSSPSFIGLKILGVLGLVSRSIQADGGTSALTPNLNVKDVFHVKTGTEKGGCDAYDVNQWYQDAFRLAKSIDQAFDVAQTAKANNDIHAEVLKYLWTYFRVSPVEDNLENMKGDIEIVLANFQETSDQDKPWIFCDSTSAEEKKWADVALTKGTGVPDPDGKTIKDSYPTVFQEVVTDRNAERRKAKKKSNKAAASVPPSFYPFWMEDLKEYRFAEKGNYCSKGRGAKNKNYGGTDDNFQPNVITFCPQNWKDGSYKTLDDIPKVTEEGVSIGKLKAEGLTLLHEMFHFAWGNEDTPDTAYTVGQISANDALDTGGYITQAKALENPESWTVFALAWDLMQKNPDYTFANTESRRIKKE